MLLGSFGFLYFVFFEIVVLESLVASTKDPIYQPNIHHKLSEILSGDKNYSLILNILDYMVS